MSGLPRGCQLLFGSRKIKTTNHVPNPGKYTMTMLRMFTLGLFIIVATGMVTVRAHTTLPHAESLDMPEVNRNCIPNYADCMDIHGTKPCCRQQELQVGQVVPEDFICFRFGAGKCQPLSSVDQLQTYAQLMKCANKTNLFKLGQYYKQKILEKNTTELEDLKP